MRFKIKKQQILDRGGQILIEAIVSCALMFMIMLALGQLMELKKNRPHKFENFKKEKLENGRN